MFGSIDEIIQANKNLGHHFFEHDFLAEVADPEIYRGKYFITKDFLRLGNLDVPGKYTIRMAGEDGGISTVCEYCQYDNLDQAKIGRAHV